METTYEIWLTRVREALASINMPMEEWQRTWKFDFSAEYQAGTGAAQAAGKANRFWWYAQNKALKQNCVKTADCWLPNGHTGECKPIEENG